MFSEINTCKGRRVRYLNNAMSHFRKTKMDIVCRKLLNYREIQQAKLERTLSEETKNVTIINRNGGPVLRLATDPGNSFYVVPEATISGLVEAFSDNLNDIEKDSYLMDIEENILEIENRIQEKEKVIESFISDGEAFQNHEIEKNSLRSILEVNNVVIHGEKSLRRYLSTLEERIDIEVKILNNQDKLYKELDSVINLLRQRVQLLWMDRENWIKQTLRKWKDNYPIEPLTGEQLSEFQDLEIGNIMDEKELPSENSANDQEM